MKLIKIGRRSTCDIVLPSDAVSSLHAELLILDNGEMFITDKNSANGTVVGGNRIQPNQEVPVRRGDYVVLGDTELPWVRVPKADDISGYDAVVNIGTNFRNDIQLNNDFCSRFHAVLKVKGRKATIKDVGSKNGVKVNGVKIQPNKEFPIKHGDNIVCADEDITSQVKPYLPSSVPAFVKPLSIVAAAAAIIALIILLWPKPEPVPTQCSLCASTYHEKLSSPVDMRPAVVCVLTTFDYVVTIEDNPLKTSGFSGEIPIKNPVEMVSGTAFFIDSLGTMGTNRHVALPWAKEYRDPDIEEQIRISYEQWLNVALGGIDVVNDEASYKVFRRSELGQMIDRATRTVPELNAMISRLRKSPISIQGVATGRFVAYPGRNYTALDELDRCDIVAESGTDDKDVAILQLNKKRTPEDIKQVFNVEHFRLDKLVPLQEQFYFIGYPRGLGWGMDSKTLSLEPGIRTVKCSKLPSRYDFEFEGESVGGASGSPIFDEYGHLVGVNWGRRTTASTFGMACQAQWLKELYDKEVASYR